MREIDQEPNTITRTFDPSKAQRFQRIRHELEKPGHQTAAPGNAPGQRRPRPPGHDQATHLDTIEGHLDKSRTTAQDDHQDTTERTR